MRLRIALVMTLLHAAALASAETVHRYIVLADGKPIGTQTTRPAAGGRMTVEYTYRNNGRGPDVREEIAVASDGTQVSHRLTGRSTFGAPIDETFRRDGPAVSWRSTADRGDRRVGGPVAYVPVSESSPEVLAVLVRAASRRPGGKLTILPAGAVEVRHLAEHRLGSGRQAVAVSLWVVTGLNYAPAYVWLTGDAKRRLFAYIGRPSGLDAAGSQHVVAAGWKTHAAKLENLQVRAQDGHLQGLATKLAHRFAGPIVIRNARVFDAEKARLGGPRDVFVHDGRIAAIYPSGAPAAGATELDATGLVVLPALFDMHGHEDPWTSVLQLAGGVTTVRDLGNHNATLATLVGKVSEGKLLGPRIIRAGLIEGASEHRVDADFVVNDLAGVKRAIDWYAQRGYPQVKLYNSFRREWVTEAAAYAHRLGLRVSGHVPEFMRAEEVVAMGYDELHHMNQVMLNFLVGPEDDTRTLARFYIVAEKAHALDLGSARVRRFLALLKKHRIVIDPTLSIYTPFEFRQGELNPALARVVDHLPASLRRRARRNPYAVNETNFERFRASYDKMVKLVGLMHRSGIPLVAGTDHPARGFILHRELELYVRAGIPPAEALKIATWNGALYTGNLDRLGSIARGKSADLIVVEGDPTRNISDVRRIRLVMKEGVVYYPSELYPAVGVRPFTEPLRPVAAAR